MPEIEFQGHHIHEMNLMIMGSKEMHCVKCGKSESELTPIKSHGTNEFGVM